VSDITIMGQIAGLSKSGGNFRHIRLDGSTESVQTITYSHHEIHAGSSFTVADVQAVNTTTVKWLLVTPNTTKWSHMVFDIECTGEMLVKITEGADRTTTTPLAIINRNRNSGNAGTLTVGSGATGGTTDGAITIFNRRSGNTGVGAKTVAVGGARGQAEWNLKQNTKYVVSVTTFAAVHVSLSLDWYEHTNKN